MVTENTGAKSALEQNQAIQSALEALKGQPLKPLLRSQRDGKISALGRALVSAKKGTTFGRLLRALNFELPLTEQEDLRAYIARVQEQFGSSTVELARYSDVGPKTLEFLGKLYDHLGRSAEEPKN